MNTTVFDFKGNQYASQKEMCKSYGISPETYRFRIKKGMSQQQALTTNIPSKSMTDHLGNKFTNKTELCKFWGITPGIYKGRENLNWSLEKILTTPISKKGKSELPTIDHIGNKFKTFKDMCNHWNINPSTVKSRLDIGYQLKDALSSSNLVKQQMTDHLGNKFDSKKELCKYWNISTSKYERGLKKNQTIEEILTINHNIQEYDDTIGNIFPDSASICKYYNIDKNTFYKRLESKKSMLETLGIIPCINKTTKEAKIYPGYILQECIHENYYMCTIFGHDIIRSYDEIIIDAQNYYSKRT